MSKRRRTTQKASRAKSPFYSVPYHKELRHPWPAQEIASPAQVERIHNASMHILENTGIQFQYPEALALWEKAGAKVDRKRQHVWIDRGLLMELIDKAPASFMWRSRNPDRSRFIGENSINFFPGAGMVFVRDLENGRRPGKREDLVNIQKLVQMTNAMHFGSLMGIVMHDVPVPAKHLTNILLGLTMTDKPLPGTSHGPIIVGDILKMMRMVFGADLQPELGPVTGGVINANSPLVYDDRMLGGMIAFAKEGQVNVVTPFILAGAMSPVTVAAAVAQQNAEALAGIAMTQLVRPGAPAVYGGFTTNVDMKSGAPAFGTPEGAWAMYLGAQLARHYKLPYRGSGTLNTSNVPDGQAMSESMWTLWPAIMAHTNFVVHSAGWLESGLTMSYEKYIMDVENLAMMQYMLQGPTFEDDDFALDAIHEVGPAGHNFGTQHTQDRYATAFYPSALHDRRNLGTWEDAGAPDTVTRANKLYKDILKNYEAPAMDSNLKQALEEFAVARAKELENVDLYD